MQKVVTKELTEVLTEEAQQAVEEASQQLALATEFSVVSADDYIQAGEQLKIIKKRERELEDLRKSLTRPLDESKAKIMAFFRPAIEHLAQASAFIERAMLGWKQEEERKRKEEEQRLQALARKEQDRLQRLAEERATRWEEKGKLEKAEEIRQSVPVIPIPVVASEMPKVQGISARTIWRYRVVCEAAVPREWLIIDDKKVAEFARATKGTIMIPGIEIYSEQILPTRS